MKNKKILILTLLAAFQHSGVGHSEVEGDEFSCFDEETGSSLNARLDRTNDETEILLKGEVVERITQDFLPASGTDYNAIAIVTSTVGGCSFESQPPLLFQCAFHRYALIRAFAENGTGTFLRLGNLEGSEQYKGYIFDYVDNVHAIGITLPLPGVGEELHYGLEFALGKCRYN